jgi:hypothetical protein
MVYLLEGKAMGLGNYRMPNPPDPRWKAAAEKANNDRRTRGPVSLWPAVLVIGVALIIMGFFYQLGM